LATSVEFNNSNERRTEYINWDKDVLPSIKKRISAFELEGVKPTIRGYCMFWNLNVLKKGDYNGLSKHLVKWREDDIQTVYFLIAYVMIVVLPIHSHHIYESFI
jgi:hypothetical protein